MKIKGSLLLLLRIFVRKNLSPILGQILTVFGDK